MIPSLYHPNFVRCEHSTPLITCIEDTWHHLQPTLEGWQHHTSRDLIWWKKQPCQFDDPHTGQWSGATFEHQGVTYMLCSNLHLNSHFSTLTLMRANRDLTHWQMCSPPVFSQPTHTPLHLTEPHIHTRGGRTYCLLTAYHKSGQVSFVTYLMQDPHRWEHLAETLTLPGELYQPLAFSPSLQTVNDRDVLTYHSPITRTVYAVTGKFKAGNFDLQGVQVLNDGLNVHRPRLVEADRYVILLCQFNTPEAHPSPLTLPTEMQVTPTGEVSLTPFLYPRYLERNATLLHRQLTQRTEVMRTLKPSHLIKLHFPEGCGKVMLEVLSPSTAGGGIRLLFDPPNRTVSIHDPSCNHNSSGMLLGQDAHVYVDEHIVEVFNSGRVLSMGFPWHPPGPFLIFRQFSSPPMATYSLYEYRS